MATLYDVRRAMYKTIEDSLPSTSETILQLASFDTSYSFSAEFFVEVNNTDTFVLSVDSNGSYSIDLIENISGYDYFFAVIDSKILLRTSNTTSGFQKIDVRKEIKYGVLDNPALIVGTGSITIPINKIYTTQVNSLNVDGNTLFDGTVTINDDMTVTADLDLNGKLDVSGETLLAASGVNTNVRGTFNVDEAATFDSTVGIVGDTTITGAVDITGDLDIGNVNINDKKIRTTEGDLTIDSFTGETIIDDNVTVTGTLDVTGISTFVGNVNANGGINVDNNFVVDNDGDLTTNKNVTVNTGGTVDINVNTTIDANTIHLGTTGASNEIDIITSLLDIDSHITTINGVDGNSTLNINVASIVLDGAVDINSGYLGIENIKIAGNTISSTAGASLIVAPLVNSNLELNTSGSGITTITNDSVTDDQVVSLTASQAMTNKTVNGLTFTENAAGFTITGGSTTEYILNLDNRSVTASSIWTLIDDSADTLVIGANDSLTIDSSNVLTTNIGTNKITISHDDVTRTDPTALTYVLEMGEAFNVVTDVSSSAEGHLTAMQLTTFTLPEYNLTTSNVANGAYITITSTSGGSAAAEDVSSIQIVGSDSTVVSQTGNIITVSSDINNPTITVTGGNSLTASNNTFTLNQASNSEVTIDLDDNIVTSTITAADDSSLVLNAGANVTVESGTDIIDYGITLNTTGSGNIDLNANTNINGTLDITGISTLSADLKVNADAYLYGETYIGSANSNIYAGVDYTDSAYLYMNSHDRWIESGFGATLTSGTKTIVLTSGSTTELISGKRYKFKKVSGTGEFGSIEMQISTITDSTTFTVNLNHTVSGSIIFDVDTAWRDVMYVDTGVEGTVTFTAMEESYSDDGISFSVENIKDNYGFSFSNKDFNINANYIYETAATLLDLNAPQINLTAPQIVGVGELKFNGDAFTVGVGAQGSIFTNNNIDINGALRVGAAGASNFTVTNAGAVDINSSLDVSGVTQLDGAVDIKSSLDVSGVTNLAASSFATTVRGSLAVVEDTTLTGDLAVNGGDLTTDKDTFNFLNQDVLVGQTNIIKTLNVGTGGYTVDTNDAYSQTINIGTGVDSISNTGTIERDIVLGNGNTIVTIPGKLQLTTGDLILSGTTTYKFALIEGGYLTDDIPLLIRDTNNADFEVLKVLKTGDVTVGNDLTVNNDLSVGVNLDVDGDIDLTGEFVKTAALDDADLNLTIAVINTGADTGAVGTKSDSITLDADLITVSGDGRVTGALRVDGDLNVYGALNYVTSEEIQLTDNYVYLNSDATDFATTVNSGIKVRTYDSEQIQTDKILEWDKATDSWLVDSNTIVDSGNYNTILNGLTVNAGSATKLETTRTIGGVSFDGTANINLPGVNILGNQDTTGKATTAGTADKVANALTAGAGLSYDDSDPDTADVLGAYDGANTRTMNLEYARTDKIGGAKMGIDTTNGIFYISLDGTDITF